MNIDYSQFLNMVPEVTLTLLLVIAFIADFCSAKNTLRKWFNPLMCVLMLAHIAVNLGTTEAATAFGGMYITGPSIGVIKSILALGTLIVLIQAKEWLSREDTAFKEGEFYMLVFSTLVWLRSTSIATIQPKQVPSSFSPQHSQAVSCSLVFLSFMAR